MAWTYSGNPAASPVDMTHYRMGDVAPDNPIATDEECAAALCENGGNTYLAAAYILETKALTFAMRPTMVKKGDRTTMYGDPAQAFLMTAKTLRMQASLQTAMPYAGAMSQAEKHSERRNTDLPQPFARKDLMSRPVWPSWESEERMP